MHLMRNVMFQLRTHEKMEVLVDRYCTMKNLDRYSIL
jgi:hypothetical protein